MSAGATFIYYAIQFVPLILVFVVFWFVLIRPQRKKDKEAKEMLNKLKVGDRICTIGGIYGTIVRIKDDVLTVEVGEAKTQMVFARWAIRNVEQLSVTNDAEQLI
ncbi:MAG: preprotein translocase subunit YajC [Clostridia bacterium]|nr:preprotein translocase subunit YajC [Clostridia bacterium]